MLVLLALDEVLDGERVHRLLGVNDVVDAELSVRQCELRGRALSRVTEESLQLREFVHRAQRGTAEAEIVEVSKDAPLGRVAVQHGSPVAALGWQLWS